MSVSPYAWNSCKINKSMSDNFNDHFALGHICSDWMPNTKWFYSRISHVRTNSSLIVRYSTTFDNMIWYLHSVLYNSCHTVKSAEKIIFWNPIRHMRGNSGFRGVCRPSTTPGSKVTDLSTLTSLAPFPNIQGQMFSSAEELWRRAYIPELFILQEQDVNLRTHAQCLPHRHVRYFELLSCF